MSENDSKGESPSVDEKRANYERFSMTVLNGEGSGYVNIRNTSYSEGNHTYSVEVSGRKATGCSCPHAVHRGAHCKHQVAVENSPIVVSSASCASATSHKVMTDGGQECDHIKDGEDNRFLPPEHPYHIPEDEVL